MSEHLPDRWRDRLYFGMASLRQGGRDGPGHLRVPAWLFALPLGAWLYLGISYALDGDGSRAMVNFVIAAAWGAVIIRLFRRQRSFKAPGRSQ